MPDKLPDQILVERMQAGHLQAFDLLVKRYQIKILSNRAYRFTSKVDGAVTMNQEIFLKAYR